MRKKWLIGVCTAIFIIIVAAVFFLPTKKGDISDVKRIIGDSALYDDTLIQEACDVVEKTFAEEFEGCTLIGLYYEESIENRFAKDIEKYRAEKGQELIVLLSTFTTSKSSISGGFKPDYIYTDWQWYLVRTPDKESWEIVGWGYA